MQFLENKKIVEDREGVEDTWVWRGDEFVGFTVKYAYNILKNEVQGGDMSLFESFWKVKTLPSAQVTAWRVLQNTIAKRDNLLR